MMVEGYTCFVIIVGIGQDIGWQKCLLVRLNHHGCYLQRFPPLSQKNKNNKKNACLKQAL